MTHTAHLTTLINTLSVIAPFSPLTKINTRARRVVKLTYGFSCHVTCMDCRVGCVLAQNTGVSFSKTLEVIHALLLRIYQLELILYLSNCYQNE